MTRAKKLLCRIINPAATIFAPPPLVPADQDTGPRGREEHPRQEKNASELHPGQAPREGVLHEDAAVDRAGVVVHEDAHVDGEGVGDEDAKGWRGERGAFLNVCVSLSACVCVCLYVRVLSEVSVTVILLFFLVW